MASITIRDLDPKLIEKLKMQAKTNGRSLQAELHDILNRSISIATSRHAFLAIADRIAAMTPKVLKRTARHSCVKIEIDR